MSQPEYTQPSRPWTHHELELMAELSAAHAVGSTVLLDVDPNRYPDQGALRRVGEPLDPAYIEQVGNTVDDRFSAIVEGVATDRTKNNIIGHMIDHVRDGGNVSYAFHHESLINYGVADGVLYEVTSKHEPKIPRHTIVSGGVTFLGQEFEGFDEAVPMAEVLGWLNHGVWYTIPNTENYQQSRFAQEVDQQKVRDNRREFKTDFATHQDEGGIMWSHAPSGTSGHKPNADDVCVLQKPGRGTLEMMAHPKTVVQAVVAKIVGANEVIFEFVGEPRRVDSEETADQMMEEMTAVLNDKDPLAKYVYRGDQAVDDTESLVA